ncbi:MAG: DUF2339 domain-containing protein [Rhizobiaceae bacterium]
MEVLVVLGLLYLLFSHSALKRRISELENKLTLFGNMPTRGDASLSSEENRPQQTSVASSPPQTTAEPKQPHPEAILASANISDKLSEDAVTQTPEQPTNQIFIFAQNFVADAYKWIVINWFFALAAISLALAGVFLVQYGVENGLLSPTLRVISAIALGITLIGVGEYIRRNLGGDEDGSFALLPSTFAGAGLVALFAGILSARVLYGLIGPMTAFIGLGLTGALAVALGWFYGPLLAIVGIIGALAAPFLVGGDSNSAYFLQLYFAGIAAVALIIDSIKRWAWLSVIGLVGAYFAAWLIYVSGSSWYGNTTTFFMLFALAAAAFALILPELQLMPNHAGPRISQVFRFGQKAEERSFARFPTLIAGGAFVASTIFIFITSLENAFFVALTAQSLLLVAAIFWMRGASALKDFAFLPPLAALGIIAIIGEGGRSIVSPSLSMLILMAGGILTSLIFAWRSYGGGSLKNIDAVYAASFAPLVALIVAFFWDLDVLLGQTNTAILLAIIAVVMAILAERFSIKDGEVKLRTALFALSAMALIAFIAFTLLGSFALTLALGVLVASAAWLGNKFNLPLMDRYVQIGILAISWRLVVSPGVIWAYEGILWQVTLAFAGTVSLLIVAYFVRRSNTRAGVKVMLESAIWSLSGVYLTIMLARYFNGGTDRTGHIFIALGGLVWLISSANQLYRIRAGVGLRRTRIALASIYGTIGTVATAVSVFWFNPLNGMEKTPEITGPFILDSIAATYALPGLLLGFVAWKFEHLSNRLRKILASWATAMIALYGGLEIRRFWHGNDVSGHFVIQGELYTYTVVMMLVSIGLLVLAFMRQSPLLRKFALAAVAVTVAKVYLVDMSGLDGLLRVVSFLVLGLVLAAMAWVNRILQQNEIKKTSQQPEPESRS